jgi:hypothetical protein
MREPEEEKVPVGISLHDLTMDQFMDLERRLVDARGQGLAISAMRDGVWDRTSLLVMKRNNNN